jgi:hypothetical protein
MKELCELTDDSTGDFVVDTSTGSRYLLDLTSPRRTMTRLPRENTPRPGYDFPEALRTLRRDGESLPILRVASVEVGRSAELWILVRTDQVVTFRQTSPVVRIVELASGDRP